MAAVKPQVVFVLGGPGAGKGTQCANIVKVGEHAYDIHMYRAIHSTDNVYDVIGIWVCSSLRWRPPATRARQWVQRRHSDRGLHKGWENCSSGDHNCLAS